MANWDVFFYTRSFPSMDSDRSMRHVSKLLTYPITIGSVLHESSPYKKQVTPEGLRSLAGIYDTRYQCSIITSLTNYIQLFSYTLNSLSQGSVGTGWCYTFAN
jgi:splicing suppressor protein 51